MTLGFLNIGAPEIILIVVGLFFVIAIGNYGKDTALGYWGSILLSILATPLIAFIVITILKFRKAR